jgi:hypothetical protein
MGVLDDAIREHLELKRKHGAAEDELQRQEEEALGPARRDVAQQHEVDTDEPEADQETTLFDGEGSPLAGDADAEPPVAEPAEPASPPELEPTALHEPAAAEPTPVESPPVEPPPVEAPLDAEAHEEPPAAPPVEPPPASDEEPPALHEEPPVAGQPPVGQQPDIGSHPPTEPYQVEVHDVADADHDEPGPEPDPRDSRLGDTEPHGFDELDEEEPGANLEDEDEEEDEDELLASDPEHDDQDVLEDTPDFLQETPEHDRLWFEQKPPRDFDFD